MPGVHARLGGGAAAHAPALHSHKHSHPYVRCGALYQAVLESADAETVGAATWGQMDASRRVSLIAGILTLKEALGPDPATRRVLEDARALADRYKAGFAADAEPDAAPNLRGPVTTDDLVFCQTVAVEALRLVQATPLQAD